MHRPTIPCILLLLPILYACSGGSSHASNSSTATPSESSTPVEQGAVNPAPVAQSASATSAASADNSAVNQRDRSGQTLTPPDQAKADDSGGDADTKILAEIRRAIVNDDTISTYGHNVKIIVKNGTATLRGPVQNAAEKSHIADLTSKVAGVTSVDNQLDIAQ